MRVRAKVTILLALLFAALISAQWVIEQRYMLPRFVDLERDSARTDMQRVVLALEREQQALVSQAADWGNWQELWKYMQGRNPAFERASLTDNSFITANIDYMAVIASDGQFKWRHGPYAKSGQSVQLRLNGDDRLETAWAKALADGSPVSGLIATDRGALVASAAPILDGKGGGPARGMVLMGRLLNQAELTRLGMQAQVTLDMRPWGQDRSADRLLQAGPRPGAAHLSESPAVTRIERAFSNRSGTPLLALGITVPRTISHSGADAVRYSTRLLAIAAGVALGALLLLLGRIVLGPLARVTGHAQRIAAAEDLSKRLNYQRRDEIGELARAFDEMVGRLAQSRRELMDRSFESGAAENASGVLHNLGNAVTPLSVNIARLEQQLRSAPADDLRLALDELQHGAPDARRQRDLVQFVRLAVGELTHALRQGRESAQRIAEQTGAIQSVLAEQRRHSRSGPVQETTTLVELIAGSLQQVAPAHRDRLEVQIAPAIAGLGPLLLPCTTLGMVLQNLVQNAAEAAAAAGMERARLRFEAELVEAAGRRILLLRARDHGAGIAAAELPKLFHKGYSTKPQATNSGLGLHWCANTLHALGGSISVASEGIGRGACFEIKLPLRTAQAQAQDHEERAA
jgi:two-component system, NtrC family, sensor kinase